MFETFDAETYDHYSTGSTYTSKVDACTRDDGRIDMVITTPEEFIYITREQAKQFFGFKD